MNNKYPFHGVFGCPSGILSLFWFASKLSKHADLQKHIEDVIQYLISARANINQTDPVNEWTPLHYAADKGRAQLARFLLKSKSDLNKLTNMGATAMMLATKKNHKNVMPELRAAEFRQFVQSQLWAIEMGVDIKIY